MGRIGHGYGSEWHLLRWMGRHRRKFDERVLKTLGREGARMEWEDFRLVKHRRMFQDAELKGVDFLDPTEYSATHEAWKEFWPQTGNAMNWDAVGWIAGPRGKRELLLVEAKAQVKEIESSCGAKAAGRAKIAKALGQVQSALGVPGSADWLSGYYQKANRIATVWFLNKQGVTTHLLDLHFCGDHRTGADCPKDDSGWQAALAKQEAHLMLPSAHPLSVKLHRMFLSVVGD